MKKQFTYGLLALGIGYSAHAQSVMDFRELHSNDLLRYTENEVRGTARFKAMSGAAGAMGGDLSAVSINPAGAAIFSDTQASLTLYNDSRIAETNGDISADSRSRNRFDIDQIGTSLVYYNNDQSSQWRKYTLTINYQTRNNYNSRMQYNGTSNEGLSDYFVGFANEGTGMPIDWLTLQNGESITDLYGTLFYEFGFGAQQAFMGYNGWFINEDENNPGYYYSNSEASSYRHRLTRESRGYNSAFEASFAGQYTDNWFFGFGFNVGVSDFYSYQNLTENGNGVNNGLANANFMNELRTYGTSVAFNAGVIYQALPNWRVGLAYHSPTWNFLTDDLRQGVNYQTMNEGELDDVHSIYPYFTNAYETYRFRAPGKWIASSALVLGGRAILNVDYSLRDYRNIHAKDNYRFYYDNVRMRQLNDHFDNEMRMSSEVRIGGEYVIKNLSLRAGYMYAQTPYKNHASFDDTQGASAGIGLTFDRFRVDLAYNYTQFSRGVELTSSAIRNLAPTTITNHGISLGLVYNFDPYLVD